MNTPTPPPLPDADREPQGQLSVLTLLKQPAATVGAAIARGEVAALTVTLTVSAVICLAVFGFVLGTYSGAAQLWAVPLKVAGGGLFAALLCLPSLLIFSVMGGMNINLPRAILILSGFLALAGLLFIGFAPVVWLFSVSTNSIGFMGFLAVAVALISFIIGGNALWKMARLLGLKNTGGLVTWWIIFIFVALQLTCTLRPLIGSYDKFLHLGEKRFFITHWINTSGN
ncbi:MAG: hypothetical protein LBK60_08960 [Verrucomicrobiales bacterium]|jgi:hypothetical protein|nr:hypothetical protein [Verrucomicrobiales bacterium]